MNKTLIACAALAFSSAGVSTAHAQYAGYGWQNQAIQAYQIAARPSGASGPTIISKTSAGDGNYYVKSYGSLHSWSTVANGAGRSLTFSYSNTLWVANYQDIIWKLVNGGWVQFPSNSCDGGNITISRTLRNNNIAVGDGNSAFVITREGSTEYGTAIRRWNGGCWEEMPGGGRAVEIAMIDTTSNRPWVRNALNDLWYWNGNGWSKHDTAIVTSVGRGFVSSYDTTQLFHCNVSPESCGVGNWSFGAMSVVSDSKAVLGSDDDVWMWVYNP